MKLDYPLHLDADGRWVHTWVRQSSIKTADMCMEKWRTDIFNVVSEPLKDASELGTACHAAVEDLLNARIENQGEMSLSDMLTAFEHYWFDVVDDITVWNKFTAASGYEAGLSKLKNWHEEIYPQLNPVEVEHTFNVPLIEDEFRVVRLTGTVDLIEKDRCWDWKFPSRDYAKQAWEYQRWDVQSIAYAFATGIPDFSYAVMHPKGASRMDLVRTEEHFAWLRQKVLALCKLIESNHRGPYPLNDNGWWCSDKWCENFTRCKGATIGGT